MLIIVAEGGAMALQPEVLFTPVNIASVGVATMAVTAVTIAFHQLFNLPSKWVAFIAALLVAYIVVGMQTTPQWFDWILAFFNGCLLFCSSMGLNQVGVATTNRRGSGAFEAKPLFIPWLE